jgi:predicted dienelactone hydrolase
VLTTRTAAAITLPLLLIVAACGGDDDATPAVTTDAAETADDTADEATDTETASPDTTVPATTAPVTTAPATIAPATTAPATAPSTAPAAADWAPIGPGPYEVGVSTVTVGADAERPLTVDVWFPIADGVDTATLSPQRYTLLPDVYYESPDAFAATAAELAGEGPFPLVVYSHGSGGLRYLHSSYTEALASYGYVVAAPDHTGNTVFDRLSGGGDPVEQIAFNRPNDVAEVITAFTDTDDPAAGPFAAAVDADRVAVTGHSFGGYTAIAMATGASTPVGEFAADDRVDAIIPLAPANSEVLVSDDALATIAVPMMVVVGTDDATTPVDPNVTRLWDLTTTAPAYRVELVAGEHQTFTDLCAYREFLPLLPDVPEFVVTTIEEYGVEGCSDGDIDDERAADITNTYVIQFLDEVFRDGPAIDESVVAPPADVVFDRR